MTNFCCLLSLVSLNLLPSLCPLPFHLEALVCHLLCGASQQPLTGRPGLCAHLTESQSPVHRPSLAHRLHTAIPSARNARLPLPVSPSANSSSPPASQGSYPKACDSLAWLLLFQQLPEADLGSRHFSPQAQPSDYPRKHLINDLGISWWLRGLAPALGPGLDPGVRGSNPTLGSLHGACFSLCLCLCLSFSLSLCLS